MLSHLLRKTPRASIRGSRSIFSTRSAYVSAAATEQSEAVIDGPAVTAMNRAQVSMQRFWKKVDVEEQGDHLTVTLDKRALKTPAGNKLRIPKSKVLVASLIAHEWENQEKLIKPHALPMTSLMSRAIDGLQELKTREGVQEALLKYLDTDTLCFQEDHPKALVRLQAEYWDPILDWTRKEFGVEIKILGSLFDSGQPPETRKRLAQAIQEMDHWELAAFERSVYTTKSFILALALLKGRLTVEQASVAAQVEVTSQIETWGEVEDTHDVDERDVRRQLGSVACILVNS